MPWDNYHFASRRIRHELCILHERFMKSCEEKQWVTAGGAKAEVGDSPESCNNVFYGPTNNKRFIAEFHVVCNIIDAICDPHFTKFNTIFQLEMRCWSGRWNTCEECDKGLCQRCPSLCCIYWCILVIKKICLLF